MSSSYFIPILAAAATTFPAPPSPPVISGISSGTPSTTGATITWTTDTLADSLVEYGTTTSYGSTTGIYDSSPKVLSHTATLSGLTLGTGYHYRITSRDAFGQATSSSDQTFTTAGAPVISGIGSTPADTTAAIVWTTDIASDSQVLYGLTSGYGSSTTLDPTAVTSHSVGLTGLTATTGYHYAVKSGVTTSTDQTFTTTSGAFDPTSITGMTWWLKNETIAGLSDDTRTGWTDSSGNANDAFDSLAPYDAPVKKTVSSIACLRFDGTDDFLTVYPGTAFFTSQPFSYVIVATLNGDGTIIDAAVGARNIFSVVGGYMSGYAGAGPLGEYSALVAGTPQIYSNLQNSPNSFLRQAGVGTVQDFGANGIGTGARLGCNISLGLFQSMDVFEVIGYNGVLSASDFNNLAAYFQAKFPGLSLPYTNF